MYPKDVFLSGLEVAGFWFLDGIVWRACAAAMSRGAGGGDYRVASYEQQRQFPFIGLYKGLISASYLLFRFLVLCLV